MEWPAKGRNVIISALSVMVRYAYHLVLAFMD